MIVELKPEFAARLDANTRLEVNGSVLEPTPVVGLREPADSDLI